MSKTLYIKTSNTCNLNCDHCFTSGSKGSKDKWDARKTADWVHTYIKYHGDDIGYTLVFHGGEPLLADINDIHWFMDQFEEYPNLRFTVTTNLVYKLTQEKIDLLAGIGSVGTSWDLGMRFQNDNQLALWERNLHTLQENNIPYHLFVSVNKPLVEMDVSDFLDTIDEYQPATLRLERMTANGNAVVNRNIFPDNEAQDNWFTEVYKQYRPRKNTLSYDIVTLDLIKQKIDNQMVKVDMSCRNCEQHMVTIGADGKLAGCPNSAGDVEHATVNEDLDVYLSSTGRVKEIAHELTFHPNCLKCDVFHLCGGDCHRLPWQGDRCGGLKHLLRYVNSEKYNRPNHIGIVNLT